MSFVPLKTTSLEKSTVPSTLSAPANVDNPVTLRLVTVATPLTTKSVAPIPPLYPLATPTWRS